MMRCVRVPRVSHRIFKVEHGVPNPGRDQNHVSGALYHPFKLTDHRLGCGDAAAEHAAEPPGDVKGVDLRLYMAAVAAAANFRASSLVLSAGSALM